VLRCYAHLVRFSCYRCGAVTMLEWSLLPADTAACNVVMGVQFLPYVPSLLLCCWFLFCSINLSFWAAFIAYTQQLIDEKGCSVLLLLLLLLLLPVVVVLLPPPLLLQHTTANFAH